VVAVHGGNTSSGLQSPEPAYSIPVQSVVNKVQSPSVFSLPGTNSTKKWDRSGTPARTLADGKMSQSPSLVAQPGWDRVSPRVSETLYSRLHVPQDDASD
jgi:hypothetical protein